MLKSRWPLGGRRPQLAARMGERKDAPVGRSLGLPLLCFAASHHRAAQRTSLLEERGEIDTTQNKAESNRTTRGREAKWQGQRMGEERQGSGGCGGGAQSASVWKFGKTSSSTTILRIRLRMKLQSNKTGSVQPSKYRSNNRPGRTARPWRRCAAPGHPPVRSTTPSTCAG